MNEANEANEREKHMKLSAALKIYPKAIAWSMVVSSCLIVRCPVQPGMSTELANVMLQMEGYQTSVIGSCKSAEVWPDKGPLGGFEHCQRCRQS